MAPQPKTSHSIFDASRAAAKRVMENKPILHYETDEMSRVRSYLTREMDITDQQFEELKRGYELISIAKRRLGI